MTDHSLSGHRHQEEALLVAILARALAHTGTHPDRTTIRRAVNEAMRAWPGEPSAQWRRWLSAASEILGVPVRTLEVTAYEAIEIARTGGSVIACGIEEEFDLVFLYAERRRPRYEHFAEHGGEVVGHRATGRRISKLIECTGDGDMSVLVVEPKMRVSHDAHMPPLDRLRAVLRPERSDIAIVLVFAVFVGLLTLATPIAVEWLVNVVAFGQFLQPVIVLSLILFAFLAFAAAMRAVQTYVVEILQRRLFVRLAGELSHKLPRVKFEAWDKQYGPEMVNRFFDVLTVQKVVASLLLDALTLILGAFVGMAVLAVYHPYLLGFDVILLLLLTAMVFIIGRGGVQSSIIESKKKYLMAEWLEDLSRCPISFRQFGGFEFARERADLLASDYLTAREGHFAILFRQIIFVLTLQVVASTALLGLGGFLVITQQLTLGQLVAAELIVAIVVGAFAKMGKHIEGYYDLMAAVDKVGHVLDLPTEVESGMLTLDASGPMCIEMHGVSYKYPAGAVGLSSVNLSVSSGSRLAILGGGGSGKTTLAELLYAVRHASSGRFEMDGTAPRDVRPAILRQHVSLAAPGEFFKGSLASNVHLERPGVTLSDVRHALDTVGLLELVQTLPGGIDTILLQDGSPLSTSQQMRLAIARAIVAFPRLLVLDGLLDQFSPDEVRALLGKLAAKERPWTLIVLTAREDVAGLLERTVYLSDGRISSEAQSGTSGGFSS